MMTNSPVYLLYAVPLGRAVIGNFFSPTGQLFEALLNPPATRHHGFGLRMSSEPSIRRGEYWEASTTVDSRYGVRRLRVYVDGQIIFRAPGDASFLCWPNDLSSHVVNPVVVADSIVSFCRFVRRILGLMSERPEKVILGIQLRNAGDPTRPLRMYSGRIKSKLDLALISEGSLQTVGEVSPARETTVHVDAFLSDPSNEFFIADQESYRLALGFYSMFGLEASDFPYSASRDGAHVVDINAFGS